MSIPTIQADVMLLGWSETHNGGAKITLQLADIDQLEPFKKMTLKKGKIAGQLMTAVFVEVDGNGQPVPPEPEPGTGEQTTKKRGGGKFPTGYCGLAVKWCSEPSFAEWFSNTFPNDSAAAPVDMSIDYETFSAWMVKSVCGVSSRKELDTSDRARALFDGVIRKPYMAHRKERGLE